MNVLFMDYGTPYNRSEIEAYYTDIRRGKPPTPELLSELEERYHLIGRSPLNEISYAQAARLEAALNLVVPLYQNNLTTSPGARIERGARVYRGTKHWNPYIKEAVKAMAEDGVKKAVGVVAAPHFSARSIAEYQESVLKSLEELGNPFTIAFVDEYFANPNYVQAVVTRVNEQMFRLSDPTSALYLFTAHSIPERAAQDGRYEGQIRETARLVAGFLGLKNWDIAWQSAGRTPEPWVGPDINDKLEQISSTYKEVVITAVGFPSDHLEVYFDLDYEAQITAKKFGLRVMRTRSMNADPDFINVLRDVVLAKWME